MNHVKGLLFDVGGTVFDWKNTAREAIETLAREKGETIDSEVFADDWRAGMFQVHTQVRQGNLPWMDADEMHVRALKQLAESYPLLNKIDHMSLVESTWHSLKVFEGAAAAIERLRSKYTVIVLTILSWKSIVRSSKAARVQWDGILSCEFLGYYKPSLQAYLRGVSLLGLQPEEAMMVAAHEGDLAAAQAAGLKTAYVKVPEEDKVSEGFGQGGGTAFDVQAPDFQALCRELGVD
ncbi:MAG: HAD family hydrolase [Thermodesulfobacteriota bacterium]|jgi:2-haloacid dehalogenase